MLSTKLRNHLRGCGAIVALLVGLAASCKSGSTEKVDAGQRKYCLASDATVDKGSGAMVETGIAVEAGGSSIDAAVDGVGLADTPIGHADSADVAAAEARGDDGAASIDSGLADVSVDMSSADASNAADSAMGAGGSGGVVGAGGSGGAAGAGGSGGVVGAGGSGGADAAADLVHDSATGGDFKDAAAIEASRSPDLQGADSGNDVSGHSDVGVPDGPLDVPAEGPPAIDGSGPPDAVPSGDTPSDRAPAIDSPPDVVPSGDAPVSVCAIGGASYAKKWDPAFSAMGVGADGALWATGQISKPFDFAVDKQDGGVGLTSTGGADIYLAKLDPATGLASAEFTFGAFNDHSKPVKAQIATAAAVASGANVGLVGTFDFEIDFSGNNPSGSGPSGHAGTAGIDFLQAGSRTSPFYAVISGASTGAYATPVAAHNVNAGSGVIMAIGSHPAQNYFVICGKTDQLIDPYDSTDGSNDGLLTGSVNPTAAGGGMDIFVAKIDATTGHVSWGRQFGGAGDQVCESVAMDSSGNVIVAGNYNGTLHFGGGAADFSDVNDSSGDPELGKAILFVAKLDKDTGSAISAKTWGSAGRNDAFGLTVDKDDNIVVAGSLGGNIDFGGSPDISIVDQGLTDVFVVKLSSSLTPMWADSFGDKSNDQSAKSVATSSTGDVYIGGTFKGSLSSMTDSDPSNTTTDAYVLQLAAIDGAMVCAHQYGDGLGSQSISAITVARAATGSLADSVAIGGNFSSNLTVGSTTLSNDVASSAAFVARLVP